MPGVDLGVHFSAAAQDMLGIQLRSCFGTPAFRVGRLFGDELSPLPNAKEVFLYLPNNLDCFLGTVQRPPRLLKELSFDRSGFPRPSS